MQNKVIAVIIGVVLVGGGSFYAGMRYGQGGRGTRNLGGGTVRFQQGGAGMESARGIRGNGADSGFTTGEVISKDDKSVTLKLRDGGSQIVFLPGSTAVMKTVGGSAADVSVGAQLVITGTANPDGSLTAQSVQVRPEQQKTN